MLEQQWPSLTHAVETELCRAHDLVDKVGLAHSKYSGRGRGVRTAWRLALPKRASAPLGKVCLSAHALMWLAKRLDEIIAISKNIQKAAPSP